MLDALKAHRKALSLALGALMMLAGLAMLFWYQPGSGISVEEARAQANIARMEAKVQRRSGGVQARPPGPADIMDTYREQRERNVRYAVIALMVFGAAFLGFGLLKKEEEA